MSLAVTPCELLSFYCSPRKPNEGQSGRVLAAADGSLILLRGFARLGRSWLGASDGASEDRDCKVLVHSSKSGNVVPELPKRPEPAPPQIVIAICNNVEMGDQGQGHAQCQGPRLPHNFREALVGGPRNIVFASAQAVRSWPPARESAESDSPLEICLPLGAHGLHPGVGRCQGVGVGLAVLQRLR
jgi:hypothetical protein